MVAKTSSMKTSGARIDFKEALRLVLLIFRATKTAQKEPILERSGEYGPWESSRGEKA